MKTLTLIAVALTLILLALLDFTLFSISLLILISLACILGSILKSHPANKPR